jgi:hypothetical protein
MKTRKARAGNSGPQFSKGQETTIDNDKLTKHHISHQ